MLLLLACAKSPVATQDSADPLPPLPSVWGHRIAEDFDPDPTVVEVRLQAAQTEHSFGDDPVEVWSYNGELPGPLIQARVGDRVRVVFDNALPEDETTIHWHGLRVPDVQDGIPAIVDPVEPGGTFTYEFLVEDASSFWYHPHVRGYEQIERGLYGPLIVHEAETYDIDTERYFVLDDVLLKDNGKLYGFNLDNNHMWQMHGRYGNTLLVNGSAELLEDTVRPGGVERWRVVNTASARTMWVDVEGADYRVIGVDGGLLEEPFSQNRVRVPVGARVDLEVIPHLDATEVTLSVDLPDGTGRYDSYPMFTATVEGEAGPGAPIDWIPAEVPARQEALQEIEIKLNGVAGETNIEWTINGDTFGDHEPIYASANTPTLIHITDKSNAEHPFHLHGNFFQILERNGEPADEPGLRDTVLVEGEDELWLYTELENPGRWMTHCHINEHAELGMMTELIVE